MACRSSELVVDSRDPEAPTAFWAGFGGAAPTLVVAAVAGPTPGRRRLHIDVDATDRGRDAELQRLLELDPL
ncbi:MAG: Glyoxalase/bleomycin resistance protein/dioxygenase [Blastococcus sp.]|jgi:hypothetical protein|nr:Glyoxalase/bleomycin resistance protein/dioxygenase [Blastococcus sp.]